MGTNIPQNHKVSIIVPVYNTSAYLERCLESLLSQTYPNIEIIVLNDCSTDESGSIIARYSTLDKRLVTATNDRNIGLGATRDRGLSLATGKFVMFVDSDDFLHSETVACCMSEMETHPCDLIEFQYRYYRPGEQIDVLNLPHTLQTIHCKITRENIAEMDQKVDHICCNKLFLTHIIRSKSLFFRNRYYEDTAFTREYLMNSGSVTFINFPFYFYYINPDSITHRCSPAKVVAALESADRVINVYKRHGAPERMIQKYASNSRRFTYKLLLSLSNQDLIQISEYLERAERNEILDKFDNFKFLVSHQAFRLSRMHLHATLGIRHSLKYFLSIFQ